MKKAIVIATAVLAISSISIPTYAVTGGISFEAIERSQHEQALKLEAFRVLVKILGISLKRMRQKRKKLQIKRR